MLPIELDQSSSSKGAGKAATDALELSAKNSEDVIEMLLSNPALQKQLTRQDQAQGINYELAGEVNAVLQEIEGNYYDETTKGVRYINWETRDIPYRILRRAAQTEPARLIINKRRLDLAPYGVAPKEDGLQRGFVLRFRNEDYAPTKEEKVLLKVWQQKFIDTFFYAPNDDVPSLMKFIGAAYEDWFTYDDMTIEIRRDGLGSPLAMHLQDPVIYKPVIKKKTLATIRDHDIEALSEMLGDYSKMQLGENIFEQEGERLPDYVGTYANYEFAELTRDNLIKSHFFIKSDFRDAKRGYSVVEQGLNLIAWIVNSLTMNASNFTKNKIPDGLLVLPGVGQFQLAKITKIISAYINGTYNSNRLPVVDLSSPEGKSGKPEYFHFRNNSRDMEYHLWASLLLSFWCQFSGTDPNEVSMSSHKDAVGKRSMFNDSVDGVIKESRDGGARTFLAHLADTLNTPAPKFKKNIFQHVTGLDVQCDFLGFQLVDKKMKFEIYKTELQSTASINDLLAKEDKEEFEIIVDLGDKKVNLYDIPGIGNESIKGFVQGKMSAAQQEKQAAQQNALPGGEQTATAPAEQQVQTDELTEDDKKLLEEYGNKDGVRIDDRIKEMLDQESDDEEKEEDE